MKENYIQFSAIQHIYVVYKVDEFVMCRCSKLEGFHMEKCVNVTNLTTFIFIVQYKILNSRAYIVWVQAIRIIL